MIFYFARMSTLLIIFCLFQGTLLAQSPEANQSQELSFENYLAIMAWENSFEKKIYQSRHLISQKNVALAKWDLLDDVKATFNLNDITIGRITNTNESQIFYPIYNVGAAVSLGDIFNRPKRVKKAKDEEQIALAEMGRQRRILRGEVLALFENHEAAQRVLRTKIEAEEDAFAAFTLAEKLFQSNELELSSYVSASTNYHNIQESRIRVESELRKYKIQLELLIGRSLAEATDMFTGAFNQNPTKE